MNTNPKKPYEHCSVHSIFSVFEKLSRLSRRVLLRRGGGPWARSLVVAVKTWDRPLSLEKPSRVNSNMNIHRKNKESEKE